MLVVPSLAAAVELPRRVANTGKALAGVYPFRLRDLARAVAEPHLLGRGLRPWDGGHAAHLAERLIEEHQAFPVLAGAGPRAPLARRLAATLGALRLSGVAPDVVRRLAEGASADDAERLRDVARLYGAYTERIEAAFADPVTVLRAAAERAATTPWLAGVPVLVTDDLDLSTEEARLVEALCRRGPVHRVARAAPPRLAAGGSEVRVARAVPALPPEQTVLAPILSSSASAGLSRLRTTLFEVPDGQPADDGTVELVTAPGEAGEARAVARRLLAAAAEGIPFEEMAVLLPVAEEYATLFTDLFGRLGVPCRLHPSLPLRHGRAARSLLLLLRCRKLTRPAVLEFLTFAPVPFETMLGPETPPAPAQWDLISRDAGVVSGLDRWIMGLRSFAETEREAGAREDEGRRARREARARDAEALLHVVELLSSTLDALSGEASWAEWSRQVTGVVEQWIGAAPDRQALLDLLSDLAGLGSFGRSRIAWPEVESVLEARVEWERMPMTPLEVGAVHVGSFDALAGVPFQVVAIPGLAEGSYPGVLRPDPFLLDAERSALGPTTAAPVPRPAPKPAARAGGQLSLFDLEPEPAPAPTGGVAPHGLPTTQDRLQEARRAFHRALSQATRRLVLSYPRADSRSGRERLPGLFFAAAAAALHGRPLSAADLLRVVTEDDPAALPLDLALDRAERDRWRVQREGQAAAETIAAGSAFFRQSHLASKLRWSDRLTIFDGFIGFPAEDAELAATVRARLDPLTHGRPSSASRLATFAQCGFRYLLENVLKVEPALEPEERKRLDPLERGSAFHAVAEHFLRERRQKGELPVRDTPEMRARLLQMADAELDAIVAGQPPRYLVLWQRERARFHAAALSWLEREARLAARSMPAHFEVAFGLPEGSPDEPWTPEPLTIDLGDGRALRVCGKIDRIDRRDDGFLVLRDYKTGKAPWGDPGTFRGGRQLQMSFYTLAAARLFPDAPVAEAYLDYVDGGRQVAYDPERVTGPEFQALLKQLVDVIAQGVFVQDPNECTFCDYTLVCGPRPLLERRRAMKVRDTRLQRALRLKDFA